MNDKLAKAALDRIDGLVARVAELESALATVGKARDKGELGSA
jgi:hypothetical protein